VNAAPIAHIRKAASLATLSADFETITPDQARAMLGKNVHNRNVRKNIVAMYARDIRNGAWQITGEAIKFSDTGELLDGQHRLLAIIEADMAATLLVVRGLKKESQDVMDSGTKRQAADALTLAGYKNANLLAGSARVVIGMLDDNFTDTRNRSAKSPTHTEVKEFVEDNPKLYEAVNQIAPWRRHIPIAPSVMAVAVWKLNQIDRTDCEVFFTAMAESATDGKGDPRLALIERLRKAQDLKERIHQDAQFSMIYRTWNAWRRGQRRVKVEPYGKDGEVIPIPEPR